ncbi:hypothetical protein [Taibaiella koreensis]|uniref:hypothetical protein n=1 Tax=Taibaiella koreensis TaxID=1268548 RepID=UPI000E5992BB|nr:hypothetical protein [Taibaiella koreensis]
MEAESKLEKAMAEWQQWEQRLQKLVPGHIGSKEHMRQTLAHYEVLRAKHYNTIDGFDRIALKALKGEQRKLERKLYPNLIVRLLRRMIVESDIKARANRYSRSDDTNLRSNYTDMKKAGLERHYMSAAQKMRQAVSDFSMPVALSTADKEVMDLQVHFKNRELGYAYDGYQASIKTAEGKVRSADFREYGDINQTQAYNLLKGRAVFSESRGWCQLDPNDKDAMGNNKIRQFPEQFGLDVLKALQDIPLKITDEQRLKIAERLKQGEQVDAIYVIGKKEIPVVLEASPSRGIVRIINDGALKEEKKANSIKNNVVAMQPKMQPQQRQRTLRKSK